MRGGVPMTAKRGALLASRKRSAAIGADAGPAVLNKDSERKAPTDCGAVRAGSVAIRRERIDPKGSDVHPVRKCSRTGIDAVPETPVNPMANAASAVKRRPRSARLATRRPGASGPEPPAGQPLVTIGGGGPLPFPIGNGSLPAHAARLSAATAVTTASRNIFIATTPACRMAKTTARGWHPLVLKSHTRRETGCHLSWPALTKAVDLP